MYRLCSNFTAQMTEISADRLFRWGILILLAFIWGSSFILMKIGLLNIPFKEVGAMRMFIASISLLPFGIYNWHKIQKRHWKYLGVVGIFGSGAPAFLFAYAQSFINSSLAGMLNSLVPLFTLLVGLIFFKFVPKKLHVAGVITGLIGAFFLLYKPGMSLERESLYGLYIVAATLCYAISVNTLKKHLHDLPSAAITSVSLLFVGPLCGIYLFTITDFPGRISTDPEFLKSLFSIILLSVFGTGMAIILYNMLIKRVSALYASSVTYLIPIIAIFWGIIDGEIIESLQYVGMAAILGGIYLINK